MIRGVDNSTGWQCDFIEAANAADPYTPGKRRRAELATILSRAISPDEIKRGIAEDGYVLVSDLPVDPDLPLTPKDGKRPPDKTTFISEGLLNALSYMLGAHPVAFHNEKDGDLIHQVCPVPGFENSNSNKGAERFPFHIEAPHIPSPPDIIALTAIRNSEMGCTNWVFMPDVLRTCPDEIIAALEQSEFLIRIGESFGHYTRYTWPIIQRENGKTLYRVDLAEMSPTTPHAGEALAWLRRETEKRENRIALTPGSVLLLDNRQIVHGRVGFDPDYSGGKQRWLQRQYMTYSPFAGEAADDRYPHVWRGD